MIKGFKSLSSDGKFNVVVFSFVACLIWLVISIVVEQTFGSEAKPVERQIDMVKHVYNIDGKVYELNQRVLLIDGNIKVEEIKESK